MTYSRALSVTRQQHTPCSYLLKEEYECSPAMGQAFNETLEKEVSCYEQMKSVAHTYSSKRDFVARSCIPHYARTIVPVVVNVTSNLPVKK